MKPKSILAAILGVGLTPTLAFCAEGAAEGGGSWLALIFYIINFAIFVYLLVHYAGPLTIRFFHERSRTIRENLKLSEASFREASQTANAAEAEIAGLETEKERLVAEMRAETMREVARLREAGVAAAQRIRRDAEMTASSLADNGRRTIQAHLAAATVRIARALIVNNFEAADQSRLLREFLQTVGQENRL
jgi:F0F1-type ATP synthase membrane subunit b/b'